MVPRGEPIFKFKELEDLIKKISNGYLKSNLGPPLMDSIQQKQNKCLSSQPPVLFLVLWRATASETHTHMMDNEILRDL